MTNLTDMLGLQANAQVINSDNGCSHVVRVTITQVDESNGMALAQNDEFCSQSFETEIWVSPIGYDSDKDSDADLTAFPWNGTSDDGEIEISIDF